MMMTMVALAGYLMTVTAALPLHRCGVQRSDPAGVATSGACTHCVEACVTRLPFDDVASSHLDILDGGHNSADCFVCQVLAQKSLPIIVDPAFGWDEIVSEIPNAEHCRPTLSLRFSWPIRAPPSAA
jgi:hypothetical protein